jgi:hypothetical protein
VPSEERVDKGQVYQLKLTPEQRAAIRESTGETGDMLWLTIGELEERICRAGNDGIFQLLN